MAAFSDTISVLALTLSAVTAWLTLFRRGAVKMTQPTVIYFGPDSRFESLRLRIQNITNSNAAAREQCCALAVEMLMFFEANPDELRKPEN